MKKFILGIYCLLLSPLYANAYTVEEIFFENYKEVRIYDGNFGDVNEIRNSIYNKYGLPDYTFDNQKNIWVLSPGGTEVSKWISNNPSVVTGYETVCSQISATDQVCGQKPIYNLSIIPGYYGGTLDNGLSGAGQIYNKYFVSLSAVYSVVDGELVVQDYVNLSGTTDQPTDGGTSPISPPPPPQNVCSVAPLDSNGIQTDTNICISANIISACKFIQPVYSANFGSVTAGTVAEGMTNITLICSTGQSYQFLPGVDEKTISKTKENYKVAVYKDVGKINRLLRGNANNGVGTGEIQTIPLYFKITGKGPDLGKGNIIVEGEQINDVYPIELAY